MDNNRRSFLQAVVVLGGASALAACGGESPGTDAGGTDSGTGGIDGGGPGTDAGGTDAGEAVADTGVPEVDAGGGGGGCDSTTSTIALNHGHVLTVSAADVTAAADRTYDIMGTSLHTHAVTITAAQFATLASSGTLTVTSGVGGAHTHSITVVCG